MLHLKLLCPRARAPHHLGLAKHQTKRTHSHRCPRCRHTRYQAPGAADPRVLPSSGSRFPRPRPPWRPDTRRGTTWRPYSSCRVRSRGSRGRARSTALRCTSFQITGLCLPPACSRPSIRLRQTRRPVDRMCLTRARPSGHSFVGRWWQD